MFLNVLFLFLGLLLLFIGSEWLVSGSAAIAVRYAIRPIIIGLTIVAFGTSSPEFLVSLFASQSGENGISIGNILGSNVINIALVLGASIIARPLDIRENHVKREMTLMMVATVLFWGVCMDGVISFIDGLILVIYLVFFLIFGFITAKDQLYQDEIDGIKQTAVRRNLSKIIFSVLFLCTGAHLVVDNSVSIAEFFNVSKTFIGISIVAFGTSLPELVTSVVAAKKGESDIALGNVVGSNIFNICMVMGVVGMIHPLIVETDLNYFEFPFMLVISLILMLFLFRSLSLDKKHGVVFLVCFIVYLVGSYMTVS